MSQLAKYVRQCVTQVAPGERGAVNMVFFGALVSADASASVLRELVAAHKGEYGAVDLFDGGEHGYVEIGAWLGSQGVALELIALGVKLELWNLLSPRTMLGESVTDAQELQLAQSGLLSLQAVRA